MIVLQQLINGLQLGSVYALIALGYSMVYGIILLLNFAHGDIIMVGGYIALLIIAAGISPLVAVVASVAGCVVLACLIEKAAYTPLCPQDIPADYRHRRQLLPGKRGTAHSGRGSQSVPQHRRYPLRHL